MNNYIFDLDGTLIDSMGVWDNVGHDFLVKNGIVPPKNLDDIIKEMSFEESAEFFINSLGLKMTKNEVIAGVTEYVADRYRHDIDIKPYVRDFLVKSKKNGKRMCVLTASEKYYVEPLLKRLNIDGFFENVITCSEISMSKSSCEIYNRAANIMGFKKSETAVFEDALHGVINSKKAGFYTVAVFDFKEKENMELIKKTADLYINSFKDIL